METSTVKFQTTTPHQARLDGDFLSWYFAFLAACRKGGCAAAVPSLRVISLIIKGSFSHAAQIVAADQAERLKNEKMPIKEEGEGSSDAELPAPPVVQKVPAGRITTATLEQQHAVSAMMYQWTDKKRDWAMFNQIDNEDPELGTKMLLHVMRKYMSSGTAPIAEWNRKLRRKQGDGETSEDVWNRIKTAAAALASAGRELSTVMLIDALKDSLSASHMHWVNALGPSSTIEEVDDAVYDQGLFIDQKEKGFDSGSKNAAYPSFDDAEDKDAVIRELMACIARLEGKQKGGGSGNKGSGKFNGRCNYCHELGHMIKDCPKLKKKNSKSDKKGSDDADGSVDGAAFPACFVAISSDCWDTAASDLSDFSDDSSVTCVLPTSNPFDILGDLDNFPEELEAELISVEASAAVSPPRATGRSETPVPPIFHPKPDLDLKSQKLDWRWDFISGEWVDPVKFPEILRIRTDPVSGMTYTSLFDMRDYETYPNLDVEYRAFWKTFMGNSNGASSSWSSGSGPWSPAARNEPESVEVQDYSIPECYATPPRPTGRLETSAGSDDVLILRPGLPYYEKARLRRLAREQRRSRSRQSCRSLASHKEYFRDSDSDSQSGSSSVDTWVTASDAEDTGIPVTPAFDREMLQVRYRALQRAGARRRRPKDNSVFVRLATPIARADHDSTNYYGTGQSSHAHSGFSIRMAGYIITWKRRQHPYILSEEAAAAYAAQAPGRREARCRANRWLVDSGANNHMVTDESDCVPPIVPDSGHISGVSVDIVGQGDCQVTVVTESGSILPATIHDVKITPGLSQKTNGSFCRIFSVRQAVRHGCKVVFSPSANYLALPDGTKVSLESDNGLYWLPCNFSASTTHVAAPSPAVSKLLLHRRLAHLHDEGIRRLSAMKVPGIPGSGMFQPLPFCRCCALGKSTVADICRQSTRDHDPPTCFFMMAVDNWGPVDTSAIGGYKHVFGAICYLSGYHLAELLRTKDEAPAAWRRMLLRIRTLGYTVHVVRIDNDSVFLGAAFRAVCDEFNVDVQRIVPYRHHQLARIERHWRTISDAVTSLLADAALAKSFWGYAFLTVAYIRNRVWHSGAGCIPYQKVTGNSPDLSNLRVFGCPAYVHIESARRKKLDQKAWQGVFVGYALDSPAWLIYNPATKNVIRSQNVSFHETWLPAQQRTLNLGESDATGSVTMEIQPPSTANGKSMGSPSTAAGTGNIDTPAVGEVAPPPSPASGQGETSGQGESVSTPSHPIDLDSDEDDDGRDPRHGLLWDQRTPGNDFLTPEQSSAQQSSAQQTDSPPEQVEYIGRMLADDLASLDTEAALETAALHTVATPTTTFEDTSSSDPAQLADTADSNVHSPFAAPSIAAENIPDPKSFKQATCAANPFAADWKAASDKEMDSHWKNGTWTLVRLPYGRKAIGCTWVYKTKRGKSGEILKRKARLCFRGDRQKFGIDYQAVFAPTVKYQTLRTLLALAAYYDLEVEQFDVVTAFLNADLTDSEVYMSQPDGYIKYDDKGVPFVCKLNKALYGLKQAPREWNQLLTAWLVKYGFTQNLADPGCYTISSDGHLYVLAVYVDDCILVGKGGPFIVNFKAAFGKRFKIEDLGAVSWLLGCEITRDRRNKIIRIGQRQFCIDMLEQFGMLDCSSTGTPLSARTTDGPVEKSSPLNTKRFDYPALVGKLLYLSNCTRPDITAAVNYLSRFMSNPTDQNWEQAKRVLRYVKGTMHYTLTFSGHCNPDPVCFQDASFGDGPERRSRTGFVILMCGAAIVWGSRLQTTVALSTVEAEYMSLAAACQELLHVRQLLHCLGVKFSGPFKMFEDNQGCIALATNAVTTNRTKHIDVRYHFIRQCVQRNQVKIVWIPTIDMVADILTKFSCSASQHYALAVKMMGGCYKEPSSQPSSGEC